MSNSTVNLLLVDDLPANLVALESLLKSPEIEIFKARSGKEALGLILQHDFALSIIDIQMPEMDGFELADLIRGTSRSKHIPIIFVTAVARDTKYTFKSYETGAVDFLYKPLDPYIVRSKAKVFFDLYRQKLLLNEQLDHTETALQSAEEAKKALKKSETLLKEALKLRDEFLSLASHELKTPLTSLMLHLGFMSKHVSSRLGKDGLTEKFNKMTSSAIKQVQRLTALVEDLLDVSRIRSGQLFFNIEEFDLSDLIEEMAERFSEELKLARCSFNKNVEPGIRANLDPARIEQVVVNLLANAIKYAAGNPIELSLSKTGDKAILVVKDNGPGIPSEFQGKIFDRFERVVSPRNINGLGLGLFIVKRVVEGHHGTIRVESTLGQGTKFYIELPLKDRVQKKLRENK